MEPAAIIKTLENAIEELIPFPNSDYFDAPDWDAVTLVHDWRNHIPFEAQDLWPHLSRETRLALILAASENAKREVWS